VIGELRPDGTFATMLGRFAGGVLDVRPRGVELAPDASLAYYPDDLPASTPIPVPVTGTRVDLTGRALPGNPRYFVVTSAGTPWLVASTSVWRWK